MPCDTSGPAPDSPRDAAAGPVPESVADDVLMRRYGAGDAGAARELARRFLPRVLAHAARLLGDRAEAEDVAQEAMLRLWRAAPGWQPGGARVSTWLYRVVSNLVIDRHRARGRRGRSVALEAVAEPADEGPGVEARLLEAERLRALGAAIAALPPRQREAVVLRHLEGLPNPEIAAIMGIGAEAVESLTARGRRALAAALGEEGGNGRK